MNPISSIIVKLCFVSILFILSVSCRNDNQRGKYYDESILVDQNNVPLDSNQFYFPAEEMPVVVDATEFDSISGTILIKSKTLSGTVDSSRLKYFSKFLYSINEPLLFNKNLHKDVFRFIWLPCFNNPVVIRIEKSQKEVLLFWKVTDGAGGYGLGKLAEYGCKQLNEHDWCVFERYYHNKFWKSESLNEVQLDGSLWLMEGAADGKYHLIYSTEPYGRMYKMGLYLIRLADINQYKCNLY